MANLQVPVVDQNFIVEDKVMNSLVAITKTKGLNNALITGPTGCGKTELAQHIAAVQKRPFFCAIVSQLIEPIDLLGSKGVANGQTFFRESMFVKSIETDNSVVCLDEINRCSASLLNILIPLLDHRGSMFVEELDREIKVGKNVMFIATANIGSDFSGTYRLDEAIVSRFPYRFESTFLEEDDEAKMLEAKTNCGGENARLLAKLGATLRSKAQGFGGTLSRLVSTRQLIATAELCSVGMSINDALESTIIPLYDDEGGTNSERAQCLQTVQLIVG